MMPSRCSAASGTWIRGCALPQRCPGFRTSGTDSGNDFSYGLGAKFNFSTNLSVGADYMRYFNKEDTKIDGWTVSVGYRF